MSEAPKLLGQQSAIPQRPEDAVIDVVPAPDPVTMLGKLLRGSEPEIEEITERMNIGHAGHYLVRFSCPEFTSLCPVTGAPDFAHLVIDYAPIDFMVESKALKLLLGSYRNHGAFHEACTLDIAVRLIAACRPRWLRISGFWYPRGGIPIDVFWQTGEPPAGLHIPPTDVPGYRGR
jgi:7-cyano-7-deazaguanine reductase